MILCERGCGQKSTYSTKDGRNVCAKNHWSCPIYQNRKFPHKSYAKPIPYLGLELCTYGCNLAATFKLNNGAYCCVSQGANCKKFRFSAGKKISKSLTTANEVGITPAQIGARNTAIIKTLDIDEHGLNGHQRGAIKVANNKKNKIDPSTGLNAHQLAGLKTSKWAKTDEGQKTIKRQAKDQSDRMKKINPETGVSEAERRAKLMVETKINNIDENGLNGFDRSHWKNQKGGYIDGVYYQSSNEKVFLQMMRSSNQIQNIERGLGIKYIFEGKEKTYLPDYIFNKTELFEVKSKYTMFGVDNQYLAMNIAKLNAAVREGFTVYLVIDNKVQSFSDFLATHKLTFLHAHESQPK